MSVIKIDYFGILVLEGRFIVSNPREIIMVIPSCVSVHMRFSGLMGRYVCCQRGNRHTAGAGRARV